MILGDDPPDHPDQRQKCLPPSGGPPRRKYPSDNIDYKERRRRDAKPEIRVPLRFWDEWEALRVFLHNGADTTHATVIEWLLKTTRDTIDGLLRTIAVAETARGRVEELPSSAEHREFDPEDWTFPEEVRESYAYDEQELRIFRGIDVHEMEALGLPVCTPK
ncbi:unnamed protein product [Calypogeia fissa]